MKVSTRGRYALRVMVDIAQHEEAGLVSMKAVASRQDISLKYLEQIIPMLTKSGLLSGTQGKGGGYHLGKDSHSITVGEILRITEKGLPIVSCREEGADPCPRRKDCPTIGVWEGLSRVVDDYLDSITVGELAKTAKPAKDVAPKKPATKKKQEAPKNPKPSKKTEKQAPRRSGDDFMSYLD